MRKRLKKLYEKVYFLLFPLIQSNKRKFPTYKMKVNGILLNYAKVGRGKPLIFIHGWTNNWESWIPLTTYLKKYYTLYLLDLPGFGDSDFLPGYNLKIVSSYVAQFIKKLPTKPQSIIGLSMGSFIAAETAYRYPKDVHSAILLGPLIKDLYRYSPYQLLNLVLRIFNYNRINRGAIKRLIQLRIYAYIMSKYVNMYRFNRTYVDNYGLNGKKKMRIEAFLQMGFSINAYDFKKVLTNIKIPTLIIYGREDKIAKYKNAQKLLPQNKNLSMQIIPFCGHMVHWEQSEKVASYIKKFCF